MSRAPNGPSNPRQNPKVAGQGPRARRWAQGTGHQTRRAQRQTAGIQRPPPGPGSCHPAAERAGWQASLRPRRGEKKGACSYARRGAPGGWPLQQTGEARPSWSGDGGNPARPARRLTAQGLGEPGTQRAIHPRLTLVGGPGLRRPGITPAATTRDAEASAGPAH